jgi:hypothetical protein
MKSIFYILVVTLCLYQPILAQDFEGSWQLIQYNDEEVTDREVVKTVQDGYFALGSKNLTDDSFLGAAGGEFKIENKQLIEKRDFDTYDDSKIGEERVYFLQWEDKNTLVIYNDNEKKIWKRLSVRDDELNGNWVITGRERNGNMNTMTPGDRRTIKILGGGRFQWVAFNSATKTFMATGGGTYSAENGTYTEHIEFFSKNKDRVGATLDFNYEVKDGAWHHSGQSSKGQPIYEIWSPYAKAYPTSF